MESNKSQTGSGFIPTLSSHVTAGELTIIHCFHPTGTLYYIMNICITQSQDYHHHHHHHNL